MNSTRVIAAALLATSTAVAAAANDIKACKDDDRPIAERISICTRLIDSGGLSADDLGGAFYGRGNAWLAKGDNDRAIADYNAAAQLLPEDAFVRLNRGGAWSAKGDHDRAIADYSEAIRLDPRYVDAIYNRGNEWRAKGDYDRAIADYNEALRLDPRYKFAYHNRAISWFNKGDTDRAIVDYIKATRAGLADDPQFAQAFMKRGVARFSRDDFEDAEKDFVQADRLQRDTYTRTWLHLVRERGGIGDVEALRLDAKAARTDWPYPIPLLFVGALSPADLMRLAQAADASKQSGNQCEARFYIAEWHLIHNERRPATDLLRQVVESCPRDYYEYTAGVAELKRLADPQYVQPKIVRRTWASAADFPMGQSPEDVAGAFPPFRCRPVSLGGERAFCNYFQPPATHPQLDARNLDMLWEFPVESTSFTFNEDKLEQIAWTFEARRQPGGNVIDPAKLRGALELRFGPPISTEVKSMGRGGAIKLLDTTWVVNGERWMYRRPADGGINVNLYRFAKDAPGP